MRRRLRQGLLAAILAAQSTVLSGCVVDAVRGFVDSQTGVLRLVYEAEFGRCFEQADSASHFVSCFAQVIGRIGGQQESVSFITEMSFLLAIGGEFFGVDPVVVQVPAGMSGFRGTYDDGEGQSGELGVQAAVPCIDVRPGQQMCAEEGHELVIFDLPPDVVLPSGTFEDFDIEIEAERGSTEAVDVKILFALEARSGDTTLLVPYAPPVTSFADVPIVAIPSAASLQVIEPDLDDVETDGAIEIDLTGEPPIQVCGDANDSGQVQASDALLALKAAVGSASCDLCACDADDSGSTTAADALRILRKAVGQDVAMDCPACA